MQCVMPTASLIPLSLLTSPTSVGLGATSMRRWSICRKKQCRTFARMLPPSDQRRMPAGEEGGITHTAKGDNHGEDQKEYRVLPRHLGRRVELQQGDPRSSRGGLRSDGRPISNGPSGSLT